MFDNVTFSVYDKKSVSEKKFIVDKIVCHKVPSILQSYSINVY